VPERSLTVGDCVTLHLDSLAAGGEAVGRREGMAVFALWGCPGDDVEVEITEVSRRFARGVVRSVVSPSPDRVDPPCPHFGDCGGCQLQHISYEAQLRHKTALVHDALARIGGLPDVEIADTWGMDDPWRYRNRAQYHAHLAEPGDVTLGFARHRSRDIVPLTECRLQHPLSEQVRAALLQAMPRLAQTPAERAALLEVETLVSFAAGRGLATLVCDSRPPFLQSAAAALVERVPGLSGVLAARKRGRGSRHRSPSEVLSGESRLVEKLGGTGYRVSADSFFQVNRTQTERVIQLVREWAGVGPEDTVLDLYTGVGTFLLPLAGSARAAIGIESQQAAAADARANLRHWRLSNVGIHQRKVERVLPRLIDRGEGVDIVVMDPPRKGCGPIVCALVAKLRPRRIILVSCNPATLARDLKDLAEHGYTCRRAQPVDMFPQTWHVETVTLCEPVRTAHT